MNEIKKYVTKKELKSYFKKLYPICRSITGDGFRKSLGIIGKIVDLEYFKFKTGTNVLDWTIPKEWNIKDAYIVCPDGKKIANFKDNNLHVVNYSIPINKTMSLHELKKNIHTLPKQPNAIPYITSYYKKNWGFCIEYNKYKKLKPGKYKVVINTNLKKGELIYSDMKILGKSKKEILLSTYLCHPQMANHELSGPLVWSMLYRILKNTGPHKYTYRFLICPENIGSAAFLHKNKNNVKNIIAGYVINCVGYGNEFNYKKSRNGNTIADNAAINVLENSNFKFNILNFEPWGSDEKQFCSPGFDLPIGLIMRKTYGGFKEYHTSLDNEKLINFDTIIQSIKVYYDVLLSIENNFTPLGKIQYGTPQLSKSPIKLYRDIGNYSVKKMELSQLNMLKILNLADGTKDLLEISNNSKFKLIDYLDVVEKLLKTKYIKRK
jgi:aminopeptidase-like protein